VDAAPEAGDVGILTGTARRWRRAMARETPRTSEDASLEAIDPAAWKPGTGKTRPPRPRAATDRLTGRHPGMSVLIFSIPAMGVFILGLPVIQHGGWTMLSRAHAYVVLYTVSSLMLLMLTSLAKLREYFRSRYTAIPGKLSAFWMGLGTVMTAMVVVGALALPYPEMPPLAHVEYHQPDPYSPTDFQPIPVDRGPSELLAQSRIAQRVSQGVLGILLLVMGFALLRAIGSAAAAIARRRGRWPAWVVRLFDAVDHLLLRLSTLPQQRSRRPIPRIDRAVSLSKDYTNPLSDPSRRATMSSADLIAYSYDALCALALDMGVPRAPGQTPYEFMETFPRPLESLRDETLELTRMLVLSQYAHQEFDERDLDRVRKFWREFVRLRTRVVR